ncbi:GAF domain-containing protein [Arthrobacter sp. NamB2]|uniref:GAF domain-containing protein n=1 Tax=Arthrobacter sp. NamB2 TaxID=2576035 RepID=UPI00167BF172|nr:GAF domain-containing protein [Arthrobacter sp. NamB2]
MSTGTAGQAVGFGLAGKQEERITVLDEHLQQWSAIQTVRAAGLAVEEVRRAYLECSGDSDELGVYGYLCGLVMLPLERRNLLAHTINGLLDSSGSLVDGAHYSDERATLDSGYDDYLRRLVLSPDGYDFTAPPAGDHSTSTQQGASHDEGRGKTSALEDAEFRRCHALHETGLLESGAEERFDRITRDAREHFGVSSSSIALITADAQVIKSVVGPIGQDLPRDLALCARTIERDRTLVIPDAGSDPAWRDHPLVADGPEVRFYAGHPVSTAEGWRIGSLCIIDDRPRRFTEEDEVHLRRFAAQVQLELWA